MFVFLEMPHFQNRMEKMGHFKKPPVVRFGHYNYKDPELPLLFQNRVYIQVAKYGKARSAFA